MPNSLRYLQEQFIGSLNVSDASQLQTLIQPHSKLSLNQQFKVYQDSITGRLNKALQDIYPVCKELVGEIFFKGLCAAYIKLIPSHSPDLNHYGLSFPLFIHSYLPAQGLPYLPDVARLEWAWHQITHAADDLFDFEKLAGYLEQESLYLVLPQCSTLLMSFFPLMRIWEVNQKEFSADKTVLITGDTQQYFFVWHRHYVFHIDNLNPEEWQILIWIQSGLPLTMLTEQIADRFPHLVIPNLFADWVQRGWIAGFGV